MVFKELTNRDIREMCEWLEFYDKFGYLPFKKKRINLYLSNATILKLRNKAKLQNKKISSVIEFSIR